MPEWFAIGIIVVVVLAVIAGISSGVLGGYEEGIENFLGVLTGLGGLLLMALLVVSAFVELSS